MKDIICIKTRKSYVVTKEELQAMLVHLKVGSLLYKEVKKHIERMEDNERE